MSCNEWHVDTEKRLCTNIQNNIVIYYNIKGNTLKCRFKEIPELLIKKWAFEENDYRRNLADTISTAQQAIYRECIKNDI